MRIGLFAMALAGSLLACSGGSSGGSASGGGAAASQDQGNVEVWMMEIMKEDWAFNESVNRGGPSSWSRFFAPNATEVRAGMGEITGQDAIEDSFMESIQSGSLAGLVWQPDRAEVSRAGDLGYSIGTYQRRTADSLGVQTVVKGMYMRVWRRQADGSWKVEATLETPLTDPEPIPGSEGGGG